MAGDWLFLGRNQNKKGSYRVVTLYNNPTQVEAKLNKELLRMNWNGPEAVILVDMGMDDDALESVDPNVHMAETVRFSVDMTSYESAIFLTTESTYQELLDMEMQFMSLDDWTLPPLDARGDERLRVKWKDCAALDSLTLDVEVESITVEEYQTLAFGPLGFSLRAIEDSPHQDKDDKMQYYESSRQLLECLMTGTKPD